ncbi:MAG TPA: ATP-binding cassette domain-containing protein [Acetobacteraceae bacterium]|nr:ATP-binding cassette domain-containing protein [Acetobacteraceae bacterium]
MTAVELDRVTLSIGTHTVLAEASFAIHPGEFIGVLGPNGAGKTTLLRAVLGLLRPGAGSLHVFGQAPRRGDRTIGYLPQVRTVLPDLRLRGIDFIASSWHGGRWGLPSLTRAERGMIDETLDLVGARELAHRPFAAMSGGERQRLLLAQALLGSPRLLLLDEPLISLDPHHQRAVVELTKSLQTELGIAVLFSAHELNPLLGALDRVLYLGGGQAALGTVDDVISGPVLSRLYGSDIDVVRLHGRIFVMSGSHDVEHDEHRHDDHRDDDGAAHRHGHQGVHPGHA